ncbi:MAG TPA: J domain-containing protein [Chloroflexota bacterium]|jgi:hypothetical protein
MAVVEPVQPVPAVQPAARRASGWVAASASKTAGGTLFADVLAACLGGALPDAPPASAPRTAEPTPPFLFDHVERRLSAPAAASTAAASRAFYTIAAAYRAQTAPACLRLLGLELPCTEAAVRQAYREKARSLHPDAGGDARAFVALRAAYEEALRLVAPEAA